jgi:hypothetical protein
MAWSASPDVVGPTPPPGFPRLDRLPQILIDPAGGSLNVRSNFRDAVHAEIPIRL